MKTLSAIFLFLTFVSLSSLANSPENTFSSEQIKKLSGSYLEGKLDFDNPVMVDVDKDGDFDALKFEDGNVAYYKNVGTLESPSFILENANYEKYERAFFLDTKMPYPMFFADNDGDGDMDMFVVKDKVFNNQQQKFEYKVASAENSADLSTGTLITIILVLVIVLLVLAIVH
ncbi:MAG: hypothetical protein ABI543_05005 [Ignavibacteria bacterium]